MTETPPGSAAVRPMFGSDVDRLNLRTAASRLYRELLWVGHDHATAKEAVMRLVEDVCRG